MLQKSDFVPSRYSLQDTAESSLVLSRLLEYRQVFKMHWGELVGETTTKWLQGDRMSLCNIAKTVLAGEQYSKRVTLP